VDGNKKVKGRKRAAKVADVKTAPVLLVPVLETNARLVKVLADQACRGPLAYWLQQAYDCTLELTNKLGQGFVVEPWRWVVERTFAWLENARRLCRDYEELPVHVGRSPKHHEGFIDIAMIRLLRKLSGNRRTRAAVTFV